MMKASDIARALVVDAIDTTGRIRQDVAHLRELGQRAKVGAKLAIQATRSRFEQMLEDIADGAIASVDRFEQMHGQTHGGNRARSRR